MFYFLIFSMFLFLLLFLFCRYDFYFSNDLKFIISFSHFFFVCFLSLIWFLYFCVICFILMKLLFRWNYFLRFTNYKKEKSQTEMYYFPVIFYFLPNCQFVWLNFGVSKSFSNITTPNWLVYTFMSWSFQHCLKLTMINDDVCERLEETQFRSIQLIVIEGCVIPITLIPVKLHAHH